MLELARIGFRFACLGVGLWILFRARGRKLDDQVEAIARSIAVLLIGFVGGWVGTPPDQIPDWARVLGAVLIGAVLIWLGTIALYRLGRLPRKPSRSR